MTDIKYFNKLHAHVILKVLPTYKMNASKTNPLQWFLILFGGKAFINALGESIHNVFQQFLKASRIPIRPVIKLAAIKKLSVK